MKNEGIGVIRQCPGFLPSWCLIVLVGIGLRLYLIQDQVILDDDWHSIDFVMNNSLGYLLTHFTRLGATSIPLNLYTRIALTTVGLSEITLVLPSLIAGIGALLLFPLLLRRVFPDRLILIFTSFLAISPALIFYSRICRPYSIYVFSSFLAILFFYFWMTTGIRKYAFFYIVTGVLSIYCHLFAAVAVIAPLLFIFLMNMRGKASGKQREAVIAGLTILLSLVVLLGYPLLQRITHLSAGGTQFSWHTAAGLLALLCGTASPMLQVLFVILVVAGGFHLYRHNSLFLYVLVSVSAGYCCLLLIIRPDLAAVPLIAARYSIPIFPIWYLLAASGCVSIFDHFGNPPPWCYPLTAFLVAILLFLSGPLTAVYCTPNNFTNHSAFQAAYGPMDWDSPRPSDFFSPMQRSYEDMPDFYRKLRAMADVTKIIEYPMMTGNHLNPFYYYQHFHQKKVGIGYVTNVKMKDTTSKGYITGNYYIDFILGKASNPGKIRFRNFVNMKDLSQLQQSDATYVILHKNIVDEIFPQLTQEKRRSLHHGWDVYPAIKDLEPLYQNAFGPAVYEDGDIVVYPIPSEKSAAPL